MHRLVPDEIPDDCAFLYATELTYDRDQDQWTIQIDPNACLAGGATEIDIETIQTDPLKRTEAGDMIRYTGRILFSAGVVLLLDGKQVLLRRGDDAPTDPGKWTSPAGRCDGPPRYTALKEFYQELVIREADDRPVFVTLSDESDRFKDTYMASLAATDEGTTSGNWLSLPATTPAQVQERYATIQTEYGDETYDCEMLAYFDEASNTLELRLMVVVETPPDVETTALRFSDPEFNRRISRFGPKALESKRRSGALVATDKYLVENMDFPCDSP